MSDSDRPTADPEVGTPPDPAPKKSKATDYEARLLEAQRDITRRAQENADLKRRIAALEAATANDVTDDGDGEDDDDLAVEQPPARSRFRPGAEPRQRVAAPRMPDREVYGPEVTEPYRRAVNLLERAETETDRQTAFEAYHELRSRAAASSGPRRPAGEVPTREQVITPRVETNRPDGGALERDDLAEAERQGDLEGWVAAKWKGLTGARRGLR